MVSEFILDHLPFIFLPGYFIVYTILRVFKHWSDGKEPAQTSGSRCATKLFLTICLSLLDIVQVADYSPNQHYTLEETMFRVGFYVFSAIAWLFSAGLVFFDYNRRLKSQWRGQRIFWILELLSYTIILILNLMTGSYEFSGGEFFRFSLIQITCYSVSVTFCIFLTYFAIFRPNDFAVLNTDVYYKLDPRNFLNEDSLRMSEEGVFKISCTGYKTKVVNNTAITHFKFSIKVNGTVHVISKAFQDFETLDKALKSGPYSFGEGLPDLNYGKILSLNVQERGAELGRYLNQVCIIEFMSEFLLDFLNIEGTLKDNLLNKHLELHDQGFQPDLNSRSESVCLDYFTPRLDPGAVDSIFTNSSSIQWITKIKVLRPSPDISNDVDFCIKCKIPKLSFRKTIGYKLQDFSTLHKTLSKVFSPASLYFINKSFPSKLNSSDQSLTEKIRLELEHYLLEILNDPAFICKEILEFIKCDADTQQLLELIPNIKYLITDQASWENTISEDSSHITLYRLRICQKNFSEGREKEWQFLRRYREFDAFHRRLCARHGSQLLKQFAQKMKVVDPGLPSLPGKSIAPLSTSADIEGRKNGLVCYMRELCENPLISCSYAFREFIDSMAS